MNQLEEKYSAEIKNVLTNLPYKKDLDFLNNFKVYYTSNPVYATKEKNKMGI